MRNPPRLESSDEEFAKLVSADADNADLMSAIAVKHRYWPLIPCT